MTEHVIILRVQRQVSCRVMYIIVVWFDNYKRNYSKENIHKISTMGSYTVWHVGFWIAFHVSTRKILCYCKHFYSLHSLENQFQYTWMTRDTFSICYIPLKNVYVEPSTTWSLLNESRSHIEVEYRTKNIYYILWGKLPKGGGCNLIIIC